MGSGVGRRGKQNENKFPGYLWRNESYSSGVPYEARGSLPPLRKGRSGLPAKAERKQYSVPTLRVITDLKGSHFTTAWLFQNEMLDFKLLCSPKIREYREVRLPKPSQDTPTTTHGRS